MANNNESLYQQLQKETHDKLRKQDHIIAKLEKKIDKMQAQNLAQMQTLDVRMQQMMGMFQMFMMNQTIGMNQMQQQHQQQQQQQLLNTNNTPPNLQQSKSAMNIDPHLSAKPHVLKSRSIDNNKNTNEDSHNTDSDNNTDNDDGLYSKARKHAQKNRRKKTSKNHRKKTITKKDKKNKNKMKNKHSTSESIPVFDEKDLDTNIPPPNYPTINRGRSSTTNSQNSNNSRPVPPPPPPDGISSPKPAPPSRESRSKRHNKRHRDHSKSRSKHTHRDRHQNKHMMNKNNNKSIKSKHQQSYSQEIKDIKEFKPLKHHRKNGKSNSVNVEVVDFVDITIGQHSPTNSDSRKLLDNLAELTLDVDTPSDEESILYVPEADLKEDNDSDIDVNYWAKQKKRKRKHTEENEDESADDDISMLSALKNPSILDDLDDSGDSDYSGEGDDEEEEEDDEDSLHSSEDRREQSQLLSEENLSRAEKKRRKKERKKARKREKKREKKRKKREEKLRRKENKKSKKNSKSIESNSNTLTLDVNKTSIDVSNSGSGSGNGGGNGNVKGNTKEEDDESLSNKSAEVGKKRGTITGGLKKIGRVFGVGVHKDSMDSKDEVDSVTGTVGSGGDKDNKDNSEVQLKIIRPRPGSVNKTLIFKDMFKSKSKNKVLGNAVEENLSDGIGNGKEHEIGRAERGLSSISYKQQEKKEKKKKNPFGLRGFKARLVRKGTDDGVVDYGVSKKVTPKNRRKRRGSDSNISGMSIDPWFDKKKSKNSQKKLAQISIEEYPSMLAPDYGDRHMTPPPSPLEKGYRFDEYPSDESNSEIDLKLQDEMSDGKMVKKVSGSLDDYRRRGESKSTNNNSTSGAVMGDGDTMDIEVDGDVNFDQDIDIGDYNWNSYACKQMNETHSDDENSSTASKLVSPKQDIRPQSARVGSGKGKKQGFSFDGEKDKTNKKKRKNTGKKDDKKSPKKMVKSGKNKKKKIDVIVEDKKAKNSKKTVKSPKKNVKKVSKKRSSARMFNEEKKKKIKKRIKSPKADKNKAEKITNDDIKEPEVLVRARGQSINQSLTTEYKEKNEMEVEYMFANKRLKSLVPKMDYNKYEQDNNKPGYKLMLQHVIGYNGFDNLCRNNLYALKNGSLVYNVGCLAVVHDVESNKQMIYGQHKCPISSLTVFKNYICTASLKSELSKNISVIKIWDQHSLNNICEVKCSDIIGQVRHLRFSPLSSLLYLTCGSEHKNTQLVAFRVENNTGKIITKSCVNMKFKTYGGNNKTVQIYGMIFNGNVGIQERYMDQFIVYGSNILYWCQIKKNKIKGKNKKKYNYKVKYCKINKLQPKGSTDGKKEKAYHCGLFLDTNVKNKYNAGYYVLGGQSGTIYIGYKNTIILSLPAHNQRIQSIVGYKLCNQFVSIGYDGIWKIWNIDYEHNKMKEIYDKIKEKEVHIEEEKSSSTSDEDKDEYEEKRCISDYSNKIIKCGAIRIIIEDCFVPPMDNISKYAHCGYYDMNSGVLYIGTSCNSIISVSNINLKNGDNDLQIIFGGHSLGIVGVALSPKLDSLIASLSEDGLLRLWNMKINKKNKNKNKNRLDNCVALQSLISERDKKNNNKLKSSVIAWSPDGKFIATGYNMAKVCVCTAHPLKKCQEIDLTQYKNNRGKNIKINQAITALCFSYEKNILGVAVGHLAQLLLFNVEKANGNKYKCIKWEINLNNMGINNNDVIKHLYFSEDDNMLCVVTEKYDTKFYNICHKKRSINEAVSLAACDIVWWPRIPLTSYILKGLYQKDNMNWNKSELCDADICQSLKIAASADKYGVVRLHKLPALNQSANIPFKHHYGKISKIAFIPEQERLITVGLHDRCMIKWSVKQM